MPDYAVHTGMHRQVTCRQIKSLSDYCLMVHTDATGMVMLYTHVTCMHHHLCGAKQNAGDVGLTRHEASATVFQTHQSGCCSTSLCLQRCLMHVVSCR